MHPMLTRRHARAMTALIWMAAGLLLLWTPWARPNALLGFSLLYWLVGAPACVLLALQPRLPVRLLMSPRRDWPRISRHP